MLGFSVCSVTLFCESRLTWTCSATFNCNIFCLLVLCIRHIHVNFCYPLGPLIASKYQCLITDQVVHHWCHHFPAMLPGFHCCYLVCQRDMMCLVCKRGAKMHQSASPRLPVTTLHVEDVMNGWTDLLKFYAGRTEWMCQSCHTVHTISDLVYYTVVLIFRSVLIIKWTRYTNFSSLFLEQSSTCFGQFLCPSSGVFHCTHSNGVLYRFADLRN